jgi:hypothetical protein
MLLRMRQGSEKTCTKITTHILRSEGDFLKENSRL